MTALEWVGIIGSWSGLVGWILLLRFISKYNAAVNVARDWIAACEKVCTPEQCMLIADLFIAMLEERET